jgi:putative addiction module CopG family antidote
MNAIRKVDIALPEDLLDLVDQEIASGRFATRSEVIAEGLRTLKARDGEVEHWLQTDVARTYDQLMSGQEATVPLDEVIARFSDLNP